MVVSMEYVMEKSRAAKKTRLSITTIFVELATKIIKHNIWRKLTVHIQGRERILTPFRKRNHVVAIAMTM